MKKNLLFPLLVLMLGLNGCSGLLLGGAVAGGVATLHDRRSPSVVVSDQALEAQLAAKLHSYPDLNAYSHTNLTIFNGNVLVTGEAVNQSVAQKVINVIRAVPNVRQVKPYIHIGPLSTLANRNYDAMITGKVKAALLSLRLPNFDPSLVNVSTERSNVYIMGLVTHGEGDAIAKRAGRVAGVRSVIKVFEYFDGNY